MDQNEEALRLVLERLGFMLYVDWDARVGYCVCVSDGKGLRPIMAVDCVTPEAAWRSIETYTQIGAPDGRGCADE